MNRHSFRTALCLLLAAVSVVSFVRAAADQTAGYVENEWNFVDVSMNVHRGIPADASGALGRIERDGVLRVAVDASAAPFVFPDPDGGVSGGYSGADIRLARQIADWMGVELVVLPMEPALILPSLTEGRCDLAVSAVSYTPARALSYTLSKGYFFPEETEKTGLLIREEDRERITSLSDLSDKVLAAQSSSVPEAVGALRVTGYLEFRRLPSAQAVFEAVQQKTADAGFVRIPTAETFFMNNPDCGLTLAGNVSIAPDQQFLGYRVAARKGETQLAAFVNGVIDEALRRGTYGAWLEEARNRAEELGLPDAGGSGAEGRRPE